MKTNKVLKGKIILELGRYMSCATNSVDREKIYPRKLFEQRIEKIIDEIVKE